MALLDAQAIVSKCEACQMFATKLHAPASELKTIPIACLLRNGDSTCIITDNRSNFKAADFQDFYGQMGIRINYAAVVHPQTNGQVEKANGLLTEGIRKRLMTPLRRVAGVWVEELPSVLWSLRTTPNSSTQFTPFFMVYRAEAVLPSEVRYNAPRVAAYAGPDCTEGMEDALDAADEARDIALARSTVYQ
ncbi:uncharacterized protein LOC104583138 [Brachypodium distachyon]|uniref:uncharacterized protein LOC104583138 n=1 Tax=Brachypodium distachyon TaxID=15368 RepID=UPI00052FF94E|nr:uncharacterized protein LOC104583138 [Brachypodium distachyon]|eukprot:XP_010233185.1 uncharacterized protein LOC104583138 [Brachypodium distachyon]